MLYREGMCGIVGIIGPEDAAREAFLGLTTLQHRGQDAAGILSYDRGGFHQVKNLGLVESVFTRKNMDELTGTMAIGHARYSTIGQGDLTDVQPFVMSYPFGLGMVHNGNVMNCMSLADDLLKRGRRHLLTHSDTEIVLNLFAEGLARLSDSDSHGAQNFESIYGSIQSIFDRVQGSYSIVTLIAGQGLVAFRDPYGIRPLVWGRRTEQNNSTSYMIASESAALSFMGYTDIQDVAAGEVLFIDLQGVVHQKVLTQNSVKHCMFEWVYFASPESVIDEAAVYGARIQLGKNLAQLVKSQILEQHMDIDIVVPVPETSRIAAIALSEELGIPYREVLIKNRYIKRTFILDSQDKRQKAVNLKLSPVRSEIEGKSILLVDDSIVRGTTSRKIIELVRKAGAKKVYFVSTCPPIRFPCFYGIDFPEKSELIASDRDLDTIRQELGADAVLFQSQDGLQRSIGDLGQGVGEKACGSRLCMGCLDGIYPSTLGSIHEGGRELRKKGAAVVSTERNG